MTERERLDEILTDYETHGVANLGPMDIGELVQAVQNLRKNVDYRHNEMLDSAEKEYLLEKKCNELRYDLRLAADFILEHLSTTSANEQLQTILEWRRNDKESEPS